MPLSSSSVDRRIPEALSTTPGKPAGVSDAEARRQLRRDACWRLAVKCVRSAFLWSERVNSYKTAIFRRVNQEYKWDNHDALEFPDGEIVLLTFLREGQQATVLQLPAAEKPPTSSAENKNAPISGQLADFILT
jgi:hypothetical protein